MKLRDSRNKEHLTAILHNLSASREVENERSVKLVDWGGEMNLWLDVIESMMMDDQLSPFEQRRLIEKASKTRQNLEKRSFISDLNRLREKLISEEPKKYVVVFPVLGDLKALSARYRISGCLLNFRPSYRGPLFKKLKSQRNEHIKKYKDLRLYHDDLEKCDLVFFSTLAYSPQDAVYWTERSLRILLGLSSFVATYRNSVSGIMGTGRSLAPFLIAPHISVHMQDGEPTNLPDLYWHVEWHPEPTQSKFKAEHRDQICRGIARNLHVLRRGKPKFRALLDEAFIGFHEAFSETSDHDAFFKGWRMLENICGVEQGRANAAVARASVLFGDSDDVRIIANFLLERRNEIAHGDPVLMANGDRLFSPDYSSGRGFGVAAVA